MGYEIDFLSVGEGEKSGDAIALRFGNLRGQRSEQRIVVIDGGFKQSGEELVKHINKYYGASYVDIVISTHPDADHASGLEVVLEQLGVRSLWMHRPWLHTRDMAELFKGGRVTDRSVSEYLRRSLDSAHGLEQQAIAKGIPIVEPFAGQVDESGCVVALGPSREYYESLLPGFRGAPEPKAPGLLAKAGAGIREAVERIAESWNFETLDDSGETSPENNSSAIVYLAFDGRSALFTADAGIPALTLAADWAVRAGIDLSQTTFIQVPHHGSRRNVGPTILDRLVGPKRPGEQTVKSAFVSVAKDGDSKHPSKKVTNAFSRRGAPVHATQGSSKLHHRDAPDRGWVTSTPLPFYAEFEE